MTNILHLKFFFIRSKFHLNVHFALSQHCNISQQQNTIDIARAFLHRIYKLSTLLDVDLILTLMSSGG